MDSTTILSGPCKLVFDGATIYSQGNVEVKLVEERFPIKVDGFRQIQERPKDRRYEITLTPAGEFKDLSVLWPYASTVIGAKIFANETLTLWSRDATANKRVFSNAAITKLSPIRASTGQTLLGSMTFTAILKDGGVPGDADAYVVQSDDTWPSEALDISKIITPIFARSWGSSPWDAFYVGPDGMEFDFPLGLKPHVVDGLGTVNMSVTSHEGTCKFSPLGITEAQIRSAVGANAVLGSAPTTANLIAAGTGCHLTLYAAQMQDASFTFGAEAERIGAVMLKATQTLSAGALNPIYRIATSAP